MSEWEGNLEQRNALALLEWRLKRKHAFTYADAQRPQERAYWSFSQPRKLEAAGAFLDRLKYLRAYARRRGFHGVFAHSPEVN